MNVAIIPARGGSRRIPHKNRKLFHGRPIICYSIDTAVESQLFDDVYVSTDDQDIADIARGMGAKVLWRPAGLESDEIGTQAVTRGAIIQLNEEEIRPIRVCCLYATAPLIDGDWLRRAHIALKDRNYAMGVCEVPLFDAGAFYYGYADAFCTEKPLISENTVMIPLPKERVCDINTPEDWARAEQMYRALQ